MVDERVEEVNKDRDEVIITMIEGTRGEINIAYEEKRALIRPGSGDVIVNYHSLTHLHHTCRPWMHSLHVYSVLCSKITPHGQKYTYSTIQKLWKCEKEAFTGIFYVMQKCFYFPVNTNIIIRLYIM